MRSRNNVISVKNTNLRVDFVDKFNKVKSKSMRPKNSSSSQMNDHLSEGSRNLYDSAYEDTRRIQDRCKKHTSTSLNFSYELPAQCMLHGSIMDSVPRGSTRESVFQKLKKLDLEPHSNQNTLTQISFFQDGNPSAAKTTGMGKFLPEISLSHHLDYVY